MLDILAHIIGWLFFAALFLALLGLVLYMIDLFRFGLSKKKGCGPLPWWVFWRS